MKYILIVMLLIGCSVAGIAQERNIKYERESRIRSEEIPARAKTFIEQAEFPAKVKWYRDQGLERTTIEAKSKKEGRKYSIEFSKDGLVEDIEIVIEPEEIADTARSAIEAYLRSNFDKYKYCKVQRQYTGSEADLQKVLLEDTPPSATTIKYEIVVKTQKDRQKRVIEFLFTQEGKMEQQSEVLFRNIDNLEY